MLIKTVAAIIGRYMVDGFAEAEKEARKLVAHIDIEVNFEEKRKRSINEQFSYEYRN
jgi:hypothetical protein